MKLAQVYDNVSSYTYSSTHICQTNLHYNLTRIETTLHLQHHFPLFKSPMVPPNIQRLLPCGEAYLKVHKFMGRVSCIFPHWALVLSHKITFHFLNFVHSVSMIICIGAKIQSREGNNLDRTLTISFFRGLIFWKLMKYQKFVLHRYFGSQNI